MSATEIVCTDIVFPYLLVICGKRDEEFSHLDYQNTTVTQAVEHAATT